MASKQERGGWWVRTIESLDWVGRLNTVAWIVGLLGAAVVIVASLLRPWLKMPVGWLLVLVVGVFVAVVSGTELYRRA